MSVYLLDSDYYSGRHGLLQRLLSPFSFLPSSLPLPPPSLSHLPPFVQPIVKKYRYKITILNSPKRGKKAITRQLHHFDGKFRSVTDIKAHLMEELGEDVPNSIHFDVGYYEKPSIKSWLVTSEDLELMYASLKSEEIPLWCDAESHDDKKLDGKGKKRSGGTSSKLMLMSSSKPLLTSMVIITVYHSEDCGLELSTVGPTIVSILHLLFQCLGHHLNARRRNPLLMQWLVYLQKLSILPHLVLRRILALKQTSHLLQYPRERVWICA